ncbi:hypothetical protein ACJX0J_041532, partial [Zea mays]
QSPLRTPPPRQATPTGTPTKFAGQSPGTQCFKCGKIGHYANVCPQRIATTPAQNKQQTPSKGYSIARVNQVSVDDTPDGGDLVIDEQPTVEPELQQVEVAEQELIA